MSLCLQMNAKRDSKVSVSRMSAVSGEKAADPQLAAAANADGKSVVRTGPRGHTGKRQTTQIKP